VCSTPPTEPKSGLLGQAMSTSALVFAFRNPASVRAKAMTTIRCNNQVAGSRAMPTRARHHQGARLSVAEPQPIAQPGPEDLAGLGRGGGRFGEELGPE